MSFGGCEKANAGGIAAAETELQKANSEGITFLAASGDTGAAACDASDPSPITIATKGLSVNYPASSPEVTAVGGSEFNEGGVTTYWNTSNGPNGGSATSYIPEMAWNDTALRGTLAATGGGVSSCVTTNPSGTCTGGFPKPSWQVGPGVPADSLRDVPDLALTASPDHDGYILCTKGSCASGIATNHFVAGGTSASTPVFAGIVTLLNQYLVTTGVQATPGLANINPRLYQLAQGTNASSIFHDLTTGNNIVPCQMGTPSCPTSAPFQFGYTAGPGYDLVTGLGSVDANNLVTQWSAPPDFSIMAAPLTPPTVTAGQTATSTITITPANGFSGSVALSCSGLPAGAACSGGPVTSSGTLTITTQATAPAGTSTVTITGTSGSLVHTTTVTLVVQAATTPDFTIVASALAPVTVTAGGSATSTVNIAAQHGFSGSVTFSCTVSPVVSPAPTCSFNPSSVSGSGTSTLTFGTFAGMPGGTYTVIVTGTSGGGNRCCLTHTAMVTLTVQANTTPDFTLTAGVLSPASIAPGGSSSTLITIAAVNGFSGAVTFSCTVSPVVTPEPTCAFNPATINGSGSAVVTVNTVAPHAARAANSGLYRNLFNALFLPVGGLTLLGAGFTLRRRKVPGLILGCLLFSSLLLLGACGGGSMSTTPPPPSGGTPPGSYTVTVIATSGSLSHPVSAPLTVQ